MTQVYSFPKREQSEYPAKISFQQIIIEPLEASDFTDQFNRLIQDAEGNETTENTETSQGSNARNIDLSLNTIKRTPRTGNGAWVAELFLPQAVNFKDGVTYQNVELGAVGASIENSTAAGSNLLNAATSAISNEVQGLISGIMGGIQGDAGRLAAVKAASKVSNTAGSAVSSATRLALNPNSRSLFQSVPIREFTFQFKMVPETREEVREIKEIINKFREAIYPDELGVDQVALAYRFPHPFEIKMKYKGQQVFTKILPAYLRDVSTTYNTAGMGFYEDGGFTDVEVSLSFMETRPMNKEDVKAGY